MRWLICLTLIMFLPPLAWGGCGRTCATAPSYYAARVVQAVPVVQTLEVLVPALAVTFQYVPPSVPVPSPSTVAPTSQAAAGPWGERDRGRTAAAVFQERCASCHGAEKRGGVSLFDAAGANKDGKPISKIKIWDMSVRQQKMPPGKPLAQEEKDAITEWLVQD